MLGIIVTTHIYPITIWVNQENKSKMNTFDYRWVNTSDEYTNNQIRAIVGYNQAKIYWLSN